MGDIKFRAFYLGKMYQVLNIAFPYKDIKPPYKEYDGHVTLMNNEGGILNYCSYDKVKLMQYTGLKDKNGEEIFEGYIVESCNIGNREDGLDSWEGYLSVVTISEKGVDFSNFWDWNDPDSIYNIRYYQVIGNIYENPELLEVL